MHLKASLHALDWVIKLDTWGQMPLSSQKGNKGERAAILSQCHTKAMSGQNAWAVETLTLPVSHLFNLMFSEMNLSTSRSSNPPKPEWATWKPLGCHRTTYLIIVLSVMLDLKKLVNFKTKQKTITHLLDFVNFYKPATHLLDFVNFDKPATHLEGVCWGPLSLISWESWYSYVSAWLRFGQLLEV